MKQFISMSGIFTAILLPVLTQLRQSARKITRASTSKTFPIPRPAIGKNFFPGILIQIVLTPASILIKFSVQLPIAQIVQLLITRAMAAVLTPLFTIPQLIITPTTALLLQLFIIIK